MLFVDLKDVSLIERCPYLGGVGFTCTCTCTYRYYVYLILVEPVGVDGFTVNASRCGVGGVGSLISLTLPVS